MKARDNPRRRKTGSVAPVLVTRASVTVAAWLFR